MSYFFFTHLITVRRTSLCMHISDSAVEKKTAAMAAGNTDCGGRETYYFGSVHNNNTIYAYYKRHVLQ